MIKIIQGDDIHGTATVQCRSARMFSRVAAALIAAAAVLFPSLDSSASIARLKFDPAAFAEGVSLALEGMRIQSRAKAREARHRAALAAKGVAEVPMSREALKYSIDTHGMGEMLFDDWGELYIDRRFVTDDEMKTVRKIEAFVWTHLVHPMQKAGVLPVQKKSAPSAGGAVVAPAVADGTKKARAKAGGAGLPVFRGFEDARYQLHDELIAKMTAHFNAHKAEWCGGTTAQAQKIADLTPAQVKSHMIEESGGNGPASLAAWRVDPLQVNVPGDWDEAKTDLGLRKPEKRNEGTLDANVRAAIMFLARKGFGKSGKAARLRPTGFFDGWQDALRRYNARRDQTADGRYYSDAYASKILSRAKDPDAFVPIEIKLAK